MTDDWLKKADEIRQQNHPDKAVDSAGQKAKEQKFYRDNLPQVRHILTELGEVWKAQDPNRAGLLGIGGHAGHDYYVYVNTTFENKVALYLFDKGNIHQKAFFTGMTVDGRVKVPGESLRIEFGADHFDLYLPYSETFPTPDWLSYSPKRINSLDDLKSVIAELWAAGSIHISE